MTETIQLGEISIEVTRKDIKNVHLSVHPPTGKVRISISRLCARVFSRLLKIPGEE